MFHIKCLLVLLITLYVARNIDAANLICYYDSSNFKSEGAAQLTIADLDLSLQFCTHLVYGYAGIDHETYQLKSLDVDLDINREHYRKVTELKRKHPQVRFLLSVGGDKDIDINLDHNKYLTLLEEDDHRRAFVESVSNILRTYNFDGLDLAWQFPKNYPKVVTSGLRRAWNTFKGWFVGSKVVDDKAERHKTQFTALLRELRTSFKPSGYTLSLTLLPNVDAKLFIDVFTDMANVDFVNLCAFDFYTPIRDPKEADYTAPLYAPPDRHMEHNAYHQVQYWINETAPADKIILGIAAYGQAWVMTLKSGITGYPPVIKTNGPMPVNNQTVNEGRMSWPDICELMHAKDDLKRLRKVGDPTHRYGNYAYHSADEKEDTKELLPGSWVSYEDPLTASTKAGFVQARGLGGVALFDLSMDDFRGVCAGEKFPILRSIKHKMY